MIAPITSDMLCEQCLHHYSVDASMLGLPIGAWPFELPTAMGNGQPFRFQSYDSDDGRATYLQTFGCLRLTVFNT